LCLAGDIAAFKEPTVAVNTTPTAIKIYLQQNMTSGAASTIKLIIHGSRMKSKWHCLNHDLGRFDGLKRKD
jgi:hypothetical protein